MHDTAIETGRAFFECYGRASGTILDVGALDVNGTLRPLAPSGMTYTGCDTAAGPNVDVVLEDPYRLPFADGRFGLVVSTSCFEHAEFFWLLFAEMTRVTRRGGFIYLSAPTGGPVHRHPVDCWRFYPDAGKALANWSERAGSRVDLVESFIRPPGRENWSDWVAVFGKRLMGGLLVRPDKFMTDTFPDALHRMP